MNNPHRKIELRSGGFTLFELLIAASLLALLAIGALGFMSRTRARLAEQAEAEELEERRTLVYDLIRHDFDDAGRLLLPPQRRAAAQQEALLNLSGDFITPTADYKSEKGRSTKKTASTTAQAVSDRGLYADGWLQFRPHEFGNGLIGFVGSKGVIHALQFIYNPLSGGFQINSYDKEADGLPLIKETKEEHLFGDRYRLTIERTGDDRVIIKRFRLRPGAKDSEISPPLEVTSNYPYRAMVKLDEPKAEVNDLLMAGSSNGLIVTGQPLLPAMLPLDTSSLPKDMRLPNAISIDATDGIFKSVTLIRSDPTIDAAFLAGPFDGEASGKIRINAPCVGKYKTDDYIFLANAEGAQEVSAVYKIINVLSTGDCRTRGIIELRLNKVMNDAPAWSKLYSLPTDFKLTFNERTLMTRLAPPVTYTLDNHKLLRSIGGRKTVVTVGVKDFEVVPQIEDGAIRYEVKCHLQTEGNDIKGNSQAEAFATISYVASPRALNIKYEHQTIGPSIP